MAYTTLYNDIIFIEGTNKDANIVGSVNSDLSFKIGAQLKNLNDVKNDIEDIISEERDAYDSLPESFQAGVKGDKIESAIAAMDASNESLDKAIAKLNEAMK